MYGPAPDGRHPFNANSIHPGPYGPAPDRRHSFNAHPPRLAQHGPHGVGPHRHHSTGVGHPYDRRERQELPKKNVQNVQPKKKPKKRRNKKVDTDQQPAEPNQKKAKIKKSDLDNFETVDISMDDKDRIAEIRPTTLLIRNIPNKYEQGKLVKELQGLGIPFNFFYMPPAKASKGNLGYAFINLLCHESAMLFARTAEGYEYKSCPNSTKRARIEFSKLQGYENNIEYYTHVKATKSHCKPWIAANEDPSVDAGSLVVAAPSIDASPTVDVEPQEPAEVTE